MDTIDNALMPINNVRLMLTFSFLGVLYVVLIGNLYRLQVRQHGFFNELGEQQYNGLIKLPIMRAPIFDRYGYPVAVNRESYTAYFCRIACQDTRATERCLTALFPREAKRILACDNSQQCILIKRRLSDKERNYIEEVHPAGIRLVRDYRRLYPVPELGTVLGLVDIDNRGMSGIERLCNETLSGKPELRIIERDARSGMYYKQEPSVIGCCSKPIMITIDAALQRAVCKELMSAVTETAAEEGSVLIMDPDDGDIYAMANFPNYDPNDTRSVNIAHTKNRIVTERYELGSICKVFAALAALEEGLVTYDEIIDCRATKTAYIGGRKINTVHADGKIPFWKVLADSNNIGIAIVALRLGEKLYDHYRRLGFTEKPGLGFPGEQCGWVNPPHLWSKQSLISLSYGYEIAVSLLAIGRAFSVITNGGYAIKPRLIIDPALPPGAKGDRLYSPSSLAVLQESMAKTTLEGTAKRAAVDGYKIMAKTGTANIVTNGHYDGSINRYTCAGMVMAGTYKRVIVVYLKAPFSHGSYAGTNAAPLFKKVAELLLIRDKLP